MSDLMRKPPVIPDEVVPSRHDSAEAESPDGHNFRLHPLSGLLLITVDNLFWGAEALSLGLAIPVVVVLSFTVTLIAVTMVQRFLGRNGWGVSLTKALLCAILAGIPTSIMGTAFGGFILLASGLSNMNKKGK
jgi:hypothetical protein